MKKFLTVLLVIAVMFTFSFSSAFAATTENLTTADAFVKSAVNVAEGQARLNSDLSKAAQDYAAAEASKVAQMILSYLVDQPDYDIDTTAGMDAFKAEFTKWALGNDTPSTIGKKDGALEFAKTSYAAYFNEVAQKTDYEAKVAEAVDQIKAIDTYLEHGYQPDIWWIDAGWYPCNFNWPTIGSWVCNPEHFPHSMKPVADHCAANNIDLLVWFEPERVLVGTEIDLEHPDFLLYYTGENEWLRQNRLLNLGNPRALAWITDRINKLIRENGIRIYRQDFNFPPMPYWQENTEKDRDGILENLHIQGYYAFWDALLDRNPGLWIDSCASGGRRNDPETMRRAVPLHYTDVGYGNHPIKQKQHREMFEWIPYFRAHTYNWDEPDGSYGTTNHKLDEFAFQNAMTPCVTSMVEYYDSDELYALGLRMEPIWRKAAELELCGDYYPLTACNADTHDWYAMQFDDPDNRSGFVQLIRNTQAPDDSLCVSFHVEDTAATYRFDNPLSGETLQIQGKELLNGLSVTLEKRTAIILFYKY